ncbi:predicted protein [Plenodomus lingam JN3]|uniref:Predicted protein n=1 Tax=Leptosphaeria maculans (strain JN3 / isolate v23.1.3 / race Av1-4-5-6-7-8) TaxID=985895 RepID=E5A7Y3_LEPMJ|nr:predicted protein [Plenodomus lingam JN3]CBX99728.1 predicted protein [Plenodomus lingam JN3]
MMKSVSMNFSLPTTRTVRVPEDKREEDGDVKIKMEKWKKQAMPREE